MAKDLFTKKNQFSIRKLTVGVCSVIIGMSFVNSQDAAANEVTADSTTTGLAPANMMDSGAPAEEPQTPAEELNSEVGIEAPVAEPGSQLQASPAVTTRAATDEALQLTKVPVADGRLELENDKIARHFEIKDGKLRTVSIENKLAEGGDELTFEAGSKEFIIQFKETNPENRPTPPGYTPISTDKASWTLTTNSAANAGVREGAVALAQDNNLNTIWHSNYNNGTGTPNLLPAHVDITFPTARDVQTFVYVPRQDGAQNGLVKDYKIYGKADGQADFTEIKAGSITENPGSIQYIDLGSRLTNIKTLRFEALSAQNGRPFAAAAEFDVSDQSASQLRAAEEGRQADYLKQLENHLSSYQISLDKLRLAQDGIERAKTSDGETLTFTFQPYTYKTVPVTVKYVVDLAKDSKFSQSHLLISVPEVDRDRLTIDTIDLQSFKIKASDQVHDFSNQPAIAEMAGFNGFYAGLGQPVYINSFYTGSEFPLSLNTVEAANHQMVSRYYSGKTLAQLGVDEEGHTRTWNTVIGVARSNDYQVIQQDFYDYISRIGQDTYFRKQYNSWFDHMLNITAENIQSSFNEIERGFVNGGVAPLDSYVVDDGWQDMTTLWDFNQKFPNKLYDSSKQVKRFGSDFGLWVGPQGGYSQPGFLADNLVRQGLASKHAGVVYIGDKRYVEGMDKLFANYEKEFDINYWKLDGLLLNPRSDTDSNGNFIGGGHRNMYAMTEAHERWIGLYETIRREAKEPDKMWINLTSYIPPSPWFLQWVNSIWMQNAADVDYQDHVKKAQYAHLDFGNDANEAITYRDDRYEELVNLRKWQLPFANIYNHDPVYGNTANSGKKLEPNASGQRPKIDFSAEDLRTYLFMLGTRGTGFWEFYYSYNMMDDEKWQVNGEVVNWIEANYDTLKHAKFHGGKPGHGQVYGYSAWDEETGILSIRNPVNSEQDYTITLDRLVGVREGTSGMHRTTVHGDKRHDSTATTKYGDSLTIRLKPYETVVFQYSKVADTKAPELLVAKATAANTISLEFDERIVPAGASFAVAGNTVTQVTYNKDLRTAVLTLGTPLQDRQVAEVTYTNVADNAPQANKASGTVAVTAYNQGIIEDITSVDPTTPLAYSGVEGRGTFSVTVKATLDKLNQTLAEQDGQWKLAVDETGRIVFDVKGLQVTSAPFDTLKAADRGVADKLIAPGQEVVITAVREKNGGLKLYVDGQLHNTAHDKTKVNENLELSELRLASPNFAGRISRFILEDKARDFQSSPELFEAVAPRTREVAAKLDNPTATSFDPNDGGERPASSAIDQNPSTYWASNPAKDNTVEPQRLTIALAESQEVGRVIYTPRQIAKAVGNVKRAYLEYSNDGQTWNRVAFTNGNADQTITMVEGVASTPMDFTPVTAKYFRLTALETHHWNADKVNKVVAVAELTPVVTLTPDQEVPLTYAYLRETLYQAASITPEDYETDSLTRLGTAVQDALTAYSTATTQDSLDQANTALKAAIAGLTKKAVDEGSTENNNGDNNTGGETNSGGDNGDNNSNTDNQDNGGNNSNTDNQDNGGNNNNTGNQNTGDTKVKETKATRSVPETVPFDTLTTNDPNLELDSIEIIQEGVNGSLIKVYEDTIVDGKVISSRLIDIRDIVPPVTKIVRQGTRPVSTITKLVKTSDEVLTFETDRILVDSLDAGTEITSRLGVNGRVTRIYEVTFDKGIEISRKLIDEKGRVEPINEVILIGTRPIVTKPETKLRSVTETIKFDSERIEDSTLEQGKEIILQEGRDGHLTKVYEDTFINDIKTGERLVEVKDLVPAVTSISLVGTKPIQTEKPKEEPTRQNGDSLITEDKPNFPLDQVTEAKPLPETTEEKPTFPADQVNQAKPLPETAEEKPTFPADQVNEAKPLPETAEEKPTFPADQVNEAKPLPETTEEKPTFPADQVNEAKPLPETAEEKPTFSADQVPSHTTPNSLEGEGLASGERDTAPERVLLDTATGVRVQLAEGEDKRIVALHIVHKETHDKKTPTILVGKDYDLFDIELVDKDGQVIKSNYPARVSLPVDNGKEVVAVIYLPSADEASPLAFQTEQLAAGSKQVVFIAPHFSEYGIVYRTAAPTLTDDKVSVAVQETQPLPLAETKPVAARPEQARSKEASLPETGDTDSALMAIGAASLVAALGLAGRKKNDAI